MSVTFDSTFEKAVAATSTGQTFNSNAGDVAGTVTGANSNRCLIGFVGFNSILPTSVGLAWNGVPMTPIGSLTVTATYSIYFFGMIAPDGGNNALLVSWIDGLSHDVVWGAVSLYNCDQTTGWQNFATSTGTSTSPSKTVTTSSGNLVVVGGVVDNGSVPTIAAGTSAWIEGDITGNYFQGYKASASGSETVTWASSNVAWGTIGVDVIAFGGSSSPTAVGSLLLMFQ